MKVTNGAQLILPEDLLRELITSQERIVLPDGCDISDYTWDWNLRALRVRVTGDGLPTTAEGAPWQSMYLVRESDGPRDEWLRAEV